MGDIWRSKLRGDPVPWLLESNPWTRYRTMRDILNYSETNEKVQAEKKKLIFHEHIQKLVAETNNWFPYSITRHNDAKIAIYKLQMLADLGITINDINIMDLIEKVTEHVDTDLYAVRQTLPEKDQGFTKPDKEANEWHALPCDSPVIVYSLIKMGLKDVQLDKSIDKISQYWDSSKGHFCNFFFVAGQFKKHQIGCPMAGLMALQVFSQIPGLKESLQAQNAFETLDYHRRLRKSIYFFGRGKKFFTFKYPFIWYNALYLADVLSRFEFIRNTELMEELVEWILENQDEKGRFFPTSIWMAYKGWEFSNKKLPSPWITFLCCRILKNYFDSL